MITNPPFSPVKGRPPLHLRDWTPEEIAQALRMKAWMEAAVRNFLNRIPKPPETP